MAQVARGACEGSFAVGTWRLHAGPVVIAKDFPLI
jgi:hypothetical protein